MAIPIIAEQEFERDVLRSELPVLISFTADWSGPCKTVAPEVEAVAKEFEGKAKVARIDIDRSKRIATSLRVQSVPTFMVFAKGRPVASDQGILRRSQLRELLDPFLPRDAGAFRAVELMRMMSEGQVALVDTRDAASYASVRITGAVHVPIAEAEGRLAELQALPGVLIFYCRAGDKTREMALKLAEQGETIGGFLEGGLLAWEAEGLPIERPQ